ncbi:tRNA (adenosine(37)-N6)-threonylcarbamoyltransferase complex transferase subunit TsaD [TM7 phylum sp. oral taxon 350]|nr:tRNA (adenosine(37)-N6)-threonylcarbamoyltransferase complex transferase subunit TsaD [TM7 phylum sp. oral taxon 350]
MKILGIESSCDETAAAIVEDGKKLLSNVVVSQIDIHKEYGGVIPEIAARSHIEAINPVINKALAEANLTIDDIDAIAVTYAPGLIGSLLIGTLAARTLAILHHKPLVKVQHVEGHVYANFLNEKQPEFPLLALIVSGGHSQLVLFKDHGNYELLGQTNDDAIGEAFDKVAKILGLPYPGGPAIARAAKDGDKFKYHLPDARLKHPYDFSFSGLKTAVLRAVQKEVGVSYDFPSFKLKDKLKTSEINDFAASFQYTATKTLVTKTVKAYNEFQPKSVVIAGGVAANQELREQLKVALPIDIDYAPINLCTDNAAMIATLGYYKFINGKVTDPYELEVIPSISMEKTKWN